MFNTVNAQFFESEEVSILKHDYVNNGMYALFILPSENISLEEYIKSLSFSKLKEQKSEMKTTVLDIHIPKFKINSRIDFRQRLKKMGLKSIFSDFADFSSLTDERVKVDEIIQIATVSVEETGVEAAVVTVIEMYPLIARPKEYDFRPKEFKVNRPFLFCIYHEGVDVPVFISAINNPIQEKN